MNQDAAKPKGLPILTSITKAIDRDGRVATQEVMALWQHPQGKPGLIGYAFIDNEKHFVTGQMVFDPESGSKVLSLVEMNGKKTLLTGRALNERSDGGQVYYDTMTFSDQKAPGERKSFVARVQEGMPDYIHAEIGFEWPMEPRPGALIVSRRVSKPHKLDGGQQASSRGRKPAVDYGDCDLEVEAEMSL